MSATFRQQLQHVKVQELDGHGRMIREYDQDDKVFAKVERAGEEIRQKVFTKIAKKFSRERCVSENSSQMFG